MYRKLTEEQIQEAKDLRKKGYTKRQLAELFEVSSTTIWENVFSNKKRPKRGRPVKRQIYSYRKIKGVIMVVNQLRAKEYTSKEVSEELSIPLEEVNYIYSHYPLKEYAKEN